MHGDRSALLIVGMAGVMALQAPFASAREEVDPRVQQRTYTFAATGEEMPYSVFVSSKVTADAQVPFIVALHGRGGDNNSLMSDNLLKLAEEGGYIVVSPMGYNGGSWFGIPWGRPAGDSGTDRVPNESALAEQDVLNVIAMAGREFNVDPNRTYLIGHSMGGGGGLYLAATQNHYWTAVAAIAPATGRIAPFREELLKTIYTPVILIQGDADEAVPVEETRTWAEALEGAGMIHEYHEIAGGTHGSVINDGMADVFAFLAANARTSE